MTNIQIIYKLFLLVKKKLNILSINEKENFSFLLSKNENNKCNLLESFESGVLGSAVLYLIQATGAQLMPLYVTNRTSSSECLKHIAFISKMNKFYFLKIFIDFILFRHLFFFLLEKLFFLFLFAILWSILYPLLFLSIFMSHK